MTDQNTHAGQLQSEYQAAMDSLYHKGDRNKPMMPEGMLESRKKEINQTYLAGLYEIERAAKAQKSYADQLEAKASQHPTNFLNDTELSSYQARRDAIKQDGTNLDIQSFCFNAGEAASSGNKPLCLAYLDNLPDAENIKQQQQIDNLRESLKQAILPPDLRNASERANKLRYEAEIERVAAKSALFDLSGRPVSAFNPFERN